MTLAELRTLLGTNVTPPLIDSQKIADNDNAIVDYLLSQDKEEYPDWTNALTFNTDGTGAGKYCKHPDTNGIKRIFETKTSSNIGNTPPTNPLVPENTYWKEISASASAPIPEYAAGVFGSGLKIVYHNHSTLGRGLYILTEPIRPFTSVNIEAEPTKWERFTVNSQELMAAVLGLYDDRGNYNASVNTFPATGGSGASGAILKGDIWTISVAGTLGGTPVVAGQTVRALVDIPAQVAGNWAISVGSAGVPDATETVKGIAEVANQTESETASDATLGNREHTRFMTARGVRWALDALLNFIGIDRVNKIFEINGKDTLASVVFRIRNSSATILEMFNNSRLRVYGSSFLVEVPDDITDGNASINVRAEMAEAIVAKDKSSFKYWGIRSLSTGIGRAFAIYKKIIFDEGLGFETVTRQYRLRLPNQTAATQHVIASWDLSLADQILEIDLLSSMAYATNKNLIKGSRSSMVFKNTSGTVTSGGDDIVNTRFVATTGGHNWNISGTTVQLRFLNETGTGRDYDVIDTVRYTLLPLPV